MLKLLVLALASQAHPGPLPPTDAAVIRALRPGMPNLPFFHETYRDDVTIVKTPVAAERVALALPGGVDVALEVSHWACEVHYTERTLSVYPFPVRLKAKRVKSVHLETVRLVRRPAG